MVDTIFDLEIFDAAVFDMVRVRTEFAEVIKRLESYSGIQTTSDHVCEPGMDIINSPMKEIINQLERTNLIETLFTPGTCVPGLDVIRSPMKTIIEKLERS